MGEDEGRFVHICGTTSDAVNAVMARLVPSLRGVLQTLRSRDAPFSFANSTNANLVTRRTQSLNEVDRAFDTTYSVLRLWGDREKYNTYHFFFLQDYSSAC